MLTEIRRGNYTMYDLSSEMNTFYDNHVITNKSVYDNLRAKKEKNITRLKSGMQDYNTENETSYTIEDIREQGSVAMATIVQNDEKDFDIDVAIIFAEENIGENCGTRTIKNIVYESLEDKMGLFNEGPEYKTNCIRIKYSEGYHIDFAIYKRNGNDYWHAGANWNKRNPKAINNWFANQLQQKGENLRKIIRLSKMFCKSRSSWDMPAGLIQTVLCDECFFNSNRLDECLYQTMRLITKRLSNNKDVNNPTDYTKSLLTRQKDLNRLNNFKKRLEDKLDDIAKATTKKEALSAWYKFFNHEYWNDSKKALHESISSHKDTTCYSDCQPAPNEEYIDTKYEKDISYDVEIESTVRAPGFRDHPISYYLKSLGCWLPHDKTLVFTALTNTPWPYEIKWKIKNIGPEAIKRKMQRGQIIPCDTGTNNQRTEHSNFYGPHYVECYVIKDNKCVAQKRINVPIS